jgi:hypothetical protein
MNTLGCVSTLKRLAIRIPESNGGTVPLESGNLAVMNTSTNSGSFNGNSAPSDEFRHGGGSLYVRAEQPSTFAATFWPTASVQIRSSRKVGNGGGHFGTGFIGRI